MIVLAEELITTLTQPFKLNLHERSHVTAVRPYMVIVGAPAGTFTMSLKSGANTLASKTFTSASMKSDLSTADNNVHMMVNLTFTDVTPLSPGSYDLVLSSSGYTFSGTSFLGWAKEYDSVYNEVTTGGTASDYTRPLKFELWSYNRNVFTWH